MLQKPGHAFPRVNYKRHKRVSVQIFQRRADTVCYSRKNQGYAMITDARSQGDLIAALHLESVSDKGNRPTYIEPAIRYSNEHDTVQLRNRLAFVHGLAVCAQGLTIKTDMAKAASPERHNSDPSRAAANVATWRSYLPEDCVVAMINDRWHWST